MPQLSEQFGTALAVLAGHGDIKSRLIKAFNECLIDVEDTALPKAARQSYVDLHRRVTSVSPLNGEGPVCASVRKMSIVEADECARTLVSVFAEVLRSDRARKARDAVSESEPAADAIEVPAVLLKSV